MGKGWLWARRSEQCKQNSKKMQQQWEGGEK